ncbi:MAG: ferritin family protein [Sedimentisphaerales bacterium]|nr:ferritin family protein [Sedimentisphaerales bacterium]
MKEFASVNEILKYAAAREAESVRLYTEIAGYLDNEVMVKLFESIAREELRHKAKMEFELEKRGVVVANAVPLDLLDDEPELVTITSEIADDYQKALTLAAEREKMSLRLYLEMAMKVDNEEMREVCLKLAEEEARHKALFDIGLEGIAERKKHPPAAG